MSINYRLCLIFNIMLLAMLVIGCTGTRSNPAPTKTSGPATPTPTAMPMSELKPDLEKYFQGLDGGFVLYDLNAQRYLRYNPERGAQRFLPASTFKVMNSLIGLETGIIPDENYVIRWDGTHYDIPIWNQDHTMKTAIENSVVWYYQELARRVGQKKMQQYVSVANYGNKDISGPIYSFWLDGGLRISAEEQVEFLARLYRNELPFSQRAMSIVKKILVLEETGAYRLSGKTGSVQRVAPHIGWFVGYVETKGNTYIFATNIGGPGAEGDGNKAREITQNILQELGLRP